MHARVNVAWPLDALSGRRSDADGHRALGTTEHLFACPGAAQRVRRGVRRQVAQAKVRGAPLSGHGVNRSSAYGMGTLCVAVDLLTLLGSTLVMTWGASVGRVGGRRDADNPTPCASEAIGAYRLGANRLMPFTTSRPPKPPIHGPDVIATCVCSSGGFQQPGSTTLSRDRRVRCLTTGRRCRHGSSSHRSSASAALFQRRSVRSTLPSSGAHCGYR